MLSAWRTVLGVCVVGLLGLATLVGVGYARTPLPTEPQDGVTDQGSPVYYADGTTPIFRLGANREVVKHHQIPDTLRWAVLAAEDRGFYQEPGVSPVGVGRALFNNATGGDTQGGSTITQQLARNYYKGLNKDRSFRRKFREVFVALKLDRHKTKDEILDLYLNTVFFGRQSSGVQAAARAYFHKDVWKLTVAESALLAAMIQRPAYFKTQGNEPAAQALKARWRYVIDGMVGMGRLSEADAARQRFPQTQREWNTPDRSGQAPVIRERILAELQELGVPLESVLNGGLKVHTGLDQRWMEYAAQAMRDAQEPGWPQSIRGGLVSVDPRDGTIKAFYGGDPKRGQYDTVFNPAAQTGSTFKPYVLAAALKKGFTVQSLVDGSSPVKFAPDGQLTPMTAPGYRVDNDEKIGSVGTVDLVKATAMSVNTGYVKLGFVAGLDRVRRTAEDLGVPAKYLDPFKGQAGISLGVATVPAVDQAAGYAAFANGGRAVTPHFITKIVDAAGHEYPLPWATRRVLTQEQTAQVTYAMQAVVTGGTGHRAALFDRPTAGKTGTTDRNRAAWYVGFVPQLSTAVLMFNTKNSPLARIPGQTEPVSGETVPAEIWRSFMEKATQGMPVKGFPTPAFTGTRGNWSEASDARPTSCDTPEKDCVTPKPTAKTPSCKPTSMAGRCRSLKPTPAPDGTKTPTSPRDVQRWCAEPANRAKPVCQKLATAE